MNNYQFLSRMKCIHFTISFNEHAVYYRTIEDYLEELSGLADIPDDMLKRCISAGTVWELQVYPNTPVGFNLYVGSTLDEVVEAAMANESVLDQFDALKASLGNDPHPADMMQAARDFRDGEE